MMTSGAQATRARRRGHAGTLTIVAPAPAVPAIAPPALALLAAVLLLLAIAKLRRRARPG